ncbi:hypothetical protein E2C01_003470 [Portunus trituberculatus]|uniref:Uncharacterized protein n=1 Tax=Portunus trituberculatus TaxID=210409 RepID=A0A5B7CME6_PORTR|nr:hypothetical protein [Portunus trituberculatus]
MLPKAHSDVDVAPGSCQACCRMLHAVVVSGLHDQKMAWCSNFVQDMQEPQQFIGHMTLLGLTGERYISQRQYNIAFLQHHETSDTPTPSWKTSTSLDTTQDIIQHLSPQLMYR